MLKSCFLVEKSSGVHDAVASLFLVAVCSCCGCVDTKVLEAKPTLFSVSIPLVSAVLSSHRISGDEGAPQKGGRLSRLSGRVRKIIRRAVMGYLPEEEVSYKQRAEEQAAAAAKLRGEPEVRAVAVAVDWDAGMMMAMAAVLLARNGIYTCIPVCSSPSVTAAVAVGTSDATAVLLVS